MCWMCGREGDVVKVCEGEKGIEFHLCFIHDTPLNRFYLRNGKNVLYSINTSERKACKIMDRIKKAYGRYTDRRDMRGFER